MLDDDAAPGNRQAFEEDLHSHYEKMTELGINPNVAANLALKCAAGVAKPVDISQCLDLCSSPVGNADILSQNVQSLFANANTIYISFLLHCPLVSDDTETEEDPAVAGTLDICAVSSALKTIFSTLEAFPAQLESCTAMIKDLLASPLSTSLRWNSHTAQASILVILLHLPHLQQVEALDQLVAPLLSTFQHSWHACSVELEAEFQRFSHESMQNVVFLLQQFMTIRLYRQRALDYLISAASDLMQLLFVANGQIQKPVSHSAFYNDVLNSPDFNLEEDWKRWQSTASPKPFSFCRYPFMYGPDAKAKILMFDNVDHQMGEIANMLLQMPVAGSMRPYLVLQVRRGQDLIHDALTQIRAAMNSNTLKKPLKVKFVGEQGVDEGGVAKEFFQLVIQDCFCPNYGMFAYNSDTRLQWFRPSALSGLDSEFELIGIIIGLAIYNSHILDFTFPVAIYKKLLDRPLNLSDLKDVHPEIHASLESLLAYPADLVEQDMVLTFQIEYEMDFCSQTHDLLQDGSQITVTGSNRKDFVAKYVDFLLNKSVQAQFGPFKSGFERLCSGPVMPMFQPHELELVICGSHDLDFKELQRSAQYQGGYTKDCDQVKWFWSIVHEYGESDKKRLLTFVTSSDRVPINGLSSLSPPFSISKNGSHSDRLPTSHTCFNTLLLPTYDSLEFMRERLSVTVKNCHGFGLI